MRKKLLHIIYLASTILLFSCSREADVAYELPAHTTRAQLSIDLVNNGDVEQQEKINSMRFIVFGSTPGGVRLDVNEHILLSTPETATDIDAQLLEVTSSNDILVVVIANEPQSLTSKLDGIANLLTLQEMIYDISSILNSDGQIISATGMPMTGVIRDISIAPDETKTVQMPDRRTEPHPGRLLADPDGGFLHGGTAPGRRQRQVLRLVSLGFRIRRRNRYDGACVGLLLRSRMRPQRGPHRLCPQEGGPRTGLADPGQGARSLQRQKIKTRPASERVLLISGDPTTRQPRRP